MASRGERQDGAQRTAGRHGVAGHGAGERGGSRGPGGRERRVGEHGAPRRARVPVADCVDDPVRLCVIAELLISRGERPRLRAARVRSSVESCLRTQAVDGRVVAERCVDARSVRQLQAALALHLCRHPQGFVTQTKAGRGIRQGVERGGQGAGPLPRDPLGRGEQRLRPGAHGLDPELVMIPSTFCSKTP